MRILHVIHSLDPRSGGPSHALYDLVKAQINQGHSISIITTDRQSGEEWDNRDEYLQTIEKNIPKDLANLWIIPSYGRKRPWVRYAYSPQCGTLLIRALRTKFENSEKVDFVHIHGLFSQITQKATHLCKKHQIPFALRPTGALDELPLKKGAKLFKTIFLKFLLKKSLKRANFIHATSEKEVASLNNLNFDLKIRMVPLGVSFPDWNPTYYQKLFYEKFSFLKAKPFILCLSRIHPIKRLDLAIKAIKLLKDKNLNCELVVAGSFSKHQQELYELAERLNISDHVHFIGFLKEDLKTGAFFSAKSFLQTSEHENFGITIMEALVHGLKVVCTPGVATGKIVKSSQGGEISSSNPEAIAQSLEKTINHAKPSCDLKLARRVYEIYSWCNMAKQLEDYYRSSSEITSS